MPMNPRRQIRKWYSFIPPATSSRPKIRATSAPTPTKEAPPPCWIFLTPNAATEPLNSLIARRWPPTCSAWSNCARRLAPGVCHEPPALISITHLKTPHLHRLAVSSRPGRVFRRFQLQDGRGCQFQSRALPHYQRADEPCSGGY